MGDILTPSQHLCHLFIPESDHLIQEKIVLQSCHVSTYWRKFFITYMCYLCSKRIESPWFIFLQLRVQIWVGTLAAEAFIFFVWFEMECIHSQNNILERFSLLCIWFEDVGENFASWFMVYHLRHFVWKCVNQEWLPGPKKLHLNESHVLTIYIAVTYLECVGSALHDVYWLQYTTTVIHALRHYNLHSGVSSVHSSVVRAALMNVVDTGLTPAVHI